jgi:hypothetical protein
MVLRFSPKGPTWSQVKYLTITNLTQEEQTLISQVRLHSISIVAYPLSIATTNGKPSQDMINKDKQEGQS